MRAMRLLQQSAAEDLPLKLADLPTPKPGPGQILVEVQVCGVCHTDLHTIEGDIHPPHLPLTIGHQVVGRVAGLGEGVTRFKPGQRVGIPWLYRACGICEFCQRGEENLCPYAKFTGFDVDGGYADFMLAEAKYTLPLPDELTDDQAAPLLCAGIIGYRSLHKADLQRGERLGLVGFGASAHLAIQIANHWGCRTFVFTRAEEHRHHARELGAVWAGSIDDDSPEPIDRAVLFAPVGKLVPLILKKLRPGGTLAINAIHLSPIPELDYELLYGERTLRSVANATYQDGVELLELAVKIPIRATINPYPLLEANQALLDLKHSRINGEAILKIKS